MDGQTLQRLGVSELRADTLEVNEVKLAMLEGSATWDAASIPDGDEVAVDLTVTGAALGDYVICSLGTDILDLTLTSQVTVANTVTAVLANNTNAAVNLASTTLRAIVFTRET